jgi:transposase-like protein
MKRKLRKYDREFKLNAIQLYLESKRPLREISEELGVPGSTLVTWVRTGKREGLKAFPGKGHLKPEDEQLKRLHREIEVLRRERDILKKALAIFSLP